VDISKKSTHTFWHCDKFLFKQAHARIVTKAICVLWKSSWGNLKVNFTRPHGEANWVIAASSSSSSELDRYRVFMRQARPDYPSCSKSSDNLSENQNSDNRRAQRATFNWSYSVWGNVLQAISISGLSSSAASPNLSVRSQRSSVFFRTNTFGRRFHRVSSYPERFKYRSDEHFQPTHTCSSRCVSPKLVAGTSTHPGSWDRPSPIPEFAGRAGSWKRRLWSPTVPVRWVGVLWCCG